MKLLLVDGPCHGGYTAQRAPRLLRAVTSEDGCAVLDLQDDYPESSEDVSIYERAGTGAMLCYGGRRGCEVARIYNYLPDVDGELLRDTQAWRMWVLKYLKEKNVKVARRHR